MSESTQQTSPETRPAPLPPRTEPMEALKKPSKGKGESRWAFLRALYTNPLSLGSVIWLVIVVVVCFSAGLLPLADPLQQDLSRALQLPTIDHLLGTDSLGRDVLSRILYGGRGALLGALEAVVIALIIGGVFGVVAGYFGGWLDALANRVADLLFSLPALVILLAFAAIFGSNITASMATYGILVSANYLRLGQAATRAVRNELYVDAARVAGFSQRRIIFSDVMPNVVGPLIVQSSLTFGTALLIQASLGFLGLGPPPPSPDWGAMISEASRYLNKQPWLLVPTGVVLILTITAANLIGDALRDGDGKRHRFSMLLRARNHSLLASRQRPVKAATDATDSSALLSVRDLTVTFPTDDGEVDVVRGIDFNVTRGEVVGLVGESGSGKTMTALSILGAISYPGRVSKGEIRFAGQDLVALPEKQMAQIRGKRIGMISQEPMVALDPCFTVAAQLMAPLRRHRKLDRKAARAQARELLGEVGLPNVDAVMKSYPFQLSGGMAQRVAIAIALAGSPELLIADEPTTALDVTVQAGILDLLRSLREKFGMSILFVTHDLGVVADICERVIVMERGKIVERADVEKLFRNPEHPYTQQLIAATPSLIELDSHV